MRHRFTLTLVVAFLACGCGETSVDSKAVNSDPSPLQIAKEPPQLQPVEATPPSHGPATNSVGIELASNEQIMLEPDAGHRDPQPDLSQKILLGSIKSYEFQLALLTNNLANASTPGFKRKYAVLETSRQTDVTVPVAPATTRNAEVRLPVESGVYVKSVRRDHRQGTPKKTGRPLDLAIQGKGFFPITNGHEIYYVRDGRLAINADGTIAYGDVEEGYVIEPMIQVPQDSESISISSNGIVNVRVAGTTSWTNVGQIQTASFVSEENLKLVKSGVYQETDASGAPFQGSPGTGNLGELAQGFLESSNVDPLDEQRKIEECKLMLRRLNRLLPPEFSDIE